MLPQPPGSSPRCSQVWPPPLHSGLSSEAAFSQGPPPTHQSKLSNSWPLFSPLPSPPQFILTQYPVLFSPLCSPLAEGFSFRLFVELGCKLLQNMEPCVPWLPLYPQSLEGAQPLNEHAVSSTALHTGYHFPGTQPAAAELNCTEFNQGADN